MIGILLKAHYYRESPQYMPIATFTGENEDDIKELATKYLRNIKILERNKEKFVTSPWYKKASFNSHNTYRILDDGVTTSWFLKFVPNYNNEKEFPPSKCVIHTGGIIKTYIENEDGSVKLEINEK